MEIALLKMICAYAKSTTSTSHAVTDLGTLQRINEAIRLMQILALKRRNALESQVPDVA
jgi:hypothetical protein